MTDGTSKYNYIIFILVVFSVARVFFHSLYDFSINLWCKEQKKENIKWLVSKYFD